MKVKQESDRWHHQLDGHEFEQALGDGEGQRSLACYSSWGCKESDTTEWLNDNKNIKKKQTACEQDYSMRHYLL